MRDNSRRISEANKIACSHNPHRISRPPRRDLHPEVDRQQYGNAFAEFIEQFGCGWACLFHMTFVSENGLTATV
jgi:hypothetical protein